MNNVRNSRPRPVEAAHQFRNLDSFRVKIANLYYLLISKSRSAGRLAPWHSSLGLGIAHVDFLVAKKKVKWVYTASTVALVKHAKALWNWAVMQEPRKAMRGRADSGYHEMPVAMSTFRSEPDPTWSKFWVSIWNRAVLVNFKPESFLRRSNWGSHNVISTKEHPPLQMENRQGIGRIQSNGCKLSFPFLSPSCLFSQTVTTA